MAGFLYYVPGLAGPRFEALPEPVQAVLDPGGLAYRGCAGPDTGEGGIVALDAEGLRYAPDEQKWTDSGAGYWIGHAKAGLPGPDDLQRPQMLSGSDVVLADDRTWHIPAAPYLPRKFILEGGELIPGGSILERYRPQHEAAAHFWEIFEAAMKDGQGQLEYRELSQIAVVALAGNYRVGMQEVALLELLTTQNVQIVCRALVDWDAWVQMMAELETASSKKADAVPEGDD